MSEGACAAGEVDGFLSRMREAKYRGILMAEILSVLCDILDELKRIRQLLEEWGRER